MAIINNAHPGSDINLLCLLYRVIYRNSGKYTKEELKEICAPLTLHTRTDQQRRLPENLDFWMQEGHILWAPDAAGKISLLQHSDSDSPQAIAAAATKAMFAAPLENIFEATKKYQTEELFQSIGCLLASEWFLPWNGRGITTASLDEFYRSYLPSNIPNNSEKPVIRDYGCFLGYLEIDANGHCVVDPTRVLRSVLPEIFEGTRDLTIEEFLRGAAQQVPLLDSGRYRQQIESKIVGP